MVNASLVNLKKKKFSSNCRPCLEISRPDSEWRISLPRFPLDSEGSFYCEKAIAERLENRERNSARLSSQTLLTQVLIFIAAITAHLLWEGQMLGSIETTAAAVAAAKSLQSCPTLCDPRERQPNRLLPRILQARTLEWVAISFSNAWKWKVKVKSLSRVQLLATPWTVAYQAPLSMEFSRQEYWSGVPLPSPIETTEMGKSLRRFNNNYSDS